MSIWYIYLFYQPGLLIVLYIDNVRIVAPARKNVEEDFVEELQQEGFDLETEVTSLSI